MSGKLFSLLLDAINQKTPDAETAFKNGISQAGVAALLGTLGVSVDSKGQIISALASFIQQWWMDEDSSEENMINDKFVCDM